MEREFSGGVCAYKRGQKKPVKIDRIDLNMYLLWCSNKYTNNPPLKGIPLTEEWLIKFGFLKKESRSMYDNRDEYTFKNTIITLHEMSPNFYLSKHCKIETAFQNEKGVYNYLKLEYVHQLQNLYHSLTGQELTINEKRTFIRAPLRLLQG